MKSTDITINDIEQAIKSVSELKCGFQIVKIKDSKAVVTVPMEKSAKSDEIIEIASENGGWIGYSIAYNKKGMSKLEFEDAINKLVEHEVCWIDEQNFIKNQTKNDDIIYWFPGIIKNN
jgi:predicted metal-dependent hydrolase